MNNFRKIGKTFLRPFFSFALLFSLSLQIFSQEIPKDLHQWGAISSFHGLPSERVSAIAQTKDGLLWFGTERGLAKFDGRRVATISSYNLSSLKIFALKTDADGKLWIGTENGAFTMDGDDDVSPVKETSEKAINSIIFKNGETFLSSETGAIFKCSFVQETLPREGIRLQVETILPEQFQITNLAFYGESLIASTLSRGLLLIENGAASELRMSPRPYFINVLATDKNDKIWLGTQTRGNESGLYDAENISEPQRTGAGLGNVNAIAFDSENNAWIGTNANGVYRFNGENPVGNYTFFNTSGGLRSNEILTVFVDRENVVWFGTNKGVCRFDMQSPNTMRLTESSESNFVRTLFRAGGGEIFAGSNRGLFRFENGDWSQISGFENKAIYSLAQDAAGNLLVGTSNGFYPNPIPPESAKQAQKLTNDESEKSVEDIRSIQNFQGKTYISLFNRGLARIENGNVGTNFSDENVKNITVFHADKKLRFGTARNGVFSLEGDRIVQENKFEILKNNLIWKIDGSEQTGLWFAAEKGLYLYKNGELQTVLANTETRDVREIAETNAIWAATANGVVVLRYDDVFGWINSRISVEQGLPSANIFTILPPVKDFPNLLIGTNRGIARYSLTQIAPLLVPTRILSRRLHQTEELADGIDLEYPQNSLALEVAALSSRTFPEQFQYAFILRDEKGAIVDKKFSNDAQFTMENLKPGKYSAEVRAFDKNLVESAPLKFQFSIAEAPFPWSTLLLSTLLAVALVALVWAVVSQRRIFRTSKQLKIANRELSGARLDLANEAERERRRISRDLHDQTLADLRHLILLTDKSQNGAENSNRFRAEIENVSREIRRICEDLSPSVLENIGLTAALEWALSNEIEISEKDKKFAYEFTADENLEDNLNFSPAVQIQIYRIAQEVLNNISRHADASNVKMSVTTGGDGKFQMRIEDDGDGFDAKKKSGKKGRGLSNIKARASLIEAEIGWKRGENGGTIFTLEK